ncbi:auxin efflux carrier component 5-like [Euphorbia lathyris]|uniref:auxin efflux carrier component 5-like n=1 Tax=Euphorbia lathyris TaxID=212925 RepID=UPI003313D159
MIGWEDIYKVIEAMAPLYVALILGYGSVKWWKIFTPEQCEAVNSLVCFFTLPFFTFDFTSHANPFKMNYIFIAADAISKALILLVLGFWVKFSKKGSFTWFITSFSLCTMTNSLVLGVPLMKAMFGEIGINLIVQGSVVQFTIWQSLLLFLLEIRRAKLDVVVASGNNEAMEGGLGNNEGLEGSLGNNEDLEGNLGSNNDGDSGSGGRGGFWSLMKVVLVKVAMNPNSFSCFLGILWAFIANRWHLKMPSILEGSVLIMSKAGTGTAMFSMGIFMALQEKVIACGTGLTIIGMVLRFIAGPVAMAIGSIVVGLRGDVLRIAIIQAALPQAITSFIYAKEYGLHAQVLSTAVIFGMIASLPVLIAYYAILECVPN